MKTPSPNISVPAVRLLEACTPGEGRLLASAGGMPEFAAVVAAVGDLPTNRAFLTPHTEEMPHPLGTGFTPESFYRGTDDLRSFSLLTPVVPGAVSLTVKGGDLPWMHVASNEGIPSVGGLIRSRQIPGGVLAQKAKHEFGMAVHIQRSVLSALGRLTTTAIPLRVNTIDAVQTRAGEMVGLRDYLNSPEEYFTPTNYQRGEVDMEPGTGLGDLLIGRYGLQAAQYLYMTPALNVRVTELVNSRYLRTFDDDSGRHEDLLSLVLDDVISLYAVSRVAICDPVPLAPNRKDTVLRRVYGLLAEAYGFDADEVLPRWPITDKNYMSYLSRIPRLCEEKGVSEVVLKGFVQRITEVAAALHAQEMTFSRENTGGSLMARNVTYDGTVLDLSTAGEFTRRPENHIVQDYTEMALTVAILRRAVSYRERKKLPGQIWAAYREKLEVFGAESSWASRIERTLDSDEAVAAIRGTF